MQNLRKLPLPIKLPKAILGLGNPGPRFVRTRHNIGFMILDALAALYGSQWHRRHSEETAQIVLEGHKVLLVKPQTFMNNSGEVVPYLKKQGIGPDDILVVHDELEFPFGKLGCRSGGSARGHNGLKSLIQYLGTDQFARLRFGIGRPEDRERVPDYVLQNFEDPQKTDQLIEEAIKMIQELYKGA